MNLSTARFAPTTDLAAFTRLPAFQRRKLFKCVRFSKRDSKVCRCNLRTFCNFRSDDDGIAVFNSDRYAIYVSQYERAVSRKSRFSRGNRDRDRLDWIIRQSGWLRGSD